MLYKCSGRCLFEVLWGSIRLYGSRALVRLQGFSFSAGPTGYDAFGGGVRG